MKRPPRGARPPGPRRADRSGAGDARGSGSPRARGRGVRATTRVRWGVGVLAALVVIATAVWGWRARHPRRTPDDRLPTSVLVDSAQKASDRKDWPATIRWIERLAPRVPGNSTLIRNLAFALHNQVTLFSLRSDGPHPAVRTSLARIETERRALALLDSAATMARTREEWTLAREWYGQTYENLGLPLDAVQTYVFVLQHSPREPGTSSRIVWVRNRLQNPLLSDSLAGPAPRRKS
jgi:hypothetical protein